MKRAWTLAVLLCLALILPRPADWAAPRQRGGNGTLSGIVLGPKNTGVADVHVVLQTSDGRNPHSTVTDAKGRFIFPFLKPGLYDVRAEGQGLSSEWKHNVFVPRGKQTNVTLHLRKRQKGADPPAAGELQGHVREWVVPTENSLPHDPAVDLHGNVWVTLMRSNQIGRLNPQTGEWKLFPVPTPHSGPHGLVSDADGNIWFTENFVGKIGRVDVTTGQITEYAAGAARDPHTPIFGPDGALWFTAQGSNRIVRLDTKTGQMHEFRVPTPGARPYGIVAGPDGALWFCEFGVNKLGRLDPKSGAIAEYEAPAEDARPRRLVALGKALYFTDFRGGRLGRLDLRRMSFKLWPSPSGSGSEPYGICVDGDGIIWYNEFSANQLVRFDPQTGTFKRLTLPSAKSEVRNMARDPQGRVWMALSGANRVAVIE